MRRRRPKRRNRKVYYFLCNRCHQRKPTQREAIAKPGCCQSCYEAEQR